MWTPPWDPQADVQIQETHPLQLPVLSPDGTACGPKVPGEQRMLFNIQARRGQRIPTIDNTIRLVTRHFRESHVMTNRSKWHSRGEIRNPGLTCRFTNLISRKGSSRLPKYRISYSGLLSYLAIAARFHLISFVHLLLIAHHLAVFVDHLIIADYQCHIGEYFRDFRSFV